MDNPATTSQVLKLVKQSVINWPAWYLSANYEAPNGVRWVVQRAHASVNVWVDLRQGKVTKHTVKMPKSWVAA